VKVEAVSVTKFERLELVCNSEVIGTAECDNSGRATLNLSLGAGATGWLAGRCWSGDGLSAHTSPVYAAGSPAVRDPSLAAPLFQRLDWLVAFAEDFAADAEQQKHLLEIAARAREVLEKRLS
jgi:hypothetical protein